VARRMMAHCKIQQNTDRTGRSAGNPAICGGIVRSVLTAIITRAGGFTARRTLHSGHCAC
jgi:hypothetical protein